MKAKFTLLVAAALLVTVATRAQNFSSKKYADNYTAYNSKTVNRMPVYYNGDRRDDRTFEKNDRYYRREMRRYHRHRHHHRHGWY